MSLPFSFFSFATASAASRRSTFASAYRPHGARSSVRENTSLGVLFSTSAAGSSSLVWFGQ